MRLYAIRFGIMLLGFILVLIILEFTVRIKNFVNPFVNTKFWVADKLYGIRYIPGLHGTYNRSEYTTQFTINSAGWRDSEHVIEKPQGVYRILVLGDSFVEAFQVPLEKTFFKVLETELNAESGLRIEVIAIGIGGSGPTQQYFALLNEGLKYKPDLVLHTFYTQNDVIASSKKLSYSPYRGYFSLNNDGLVYEAAQTTREEEEKRTKPIFIFFRERSLLWNFISDQLSIRRQNTLRRSFVSSTLGYPPDFQVYLNEYPSEWNDAWNITQAIILMMKRAASDAGSDYLLVSLANIEQVDTGYWQQIRVDYHALPDTIDLMRPEHIITDFTHQQGIRYLSLAPTFYQFALAHPDTGLYYRKDTHWNEIGNKLAGEMLAQYILGSNLVEKKRY